MRDRRSSRQTDPAPPVNQPVDPAVGAAPADAAGAMGAADPPEPEPMDPALAAALSVRHGGIGRVTYLLLAAALAFGFERAHGVIDPSDLLLGLAWLLGLVLANFTLTICRVVNLASSPWLTGIALLPVAHLAASIHAPPMVELVVGLATWFLWLLLFVLCVALPPGFGRHRRLDWPGRVLLWMATLAALALSLWSLDLLLRPD